MNRPEPNPVRPPDSPFAATRDLLDRRSRGYRNLVVAVALVGLAAPAAAAVAADGRPLLGWLLIVPLIGTALALDARRVARWRAALLDAWAAGAADLDALRDGLTSIKLLPAGTLAGMLDPLLTRTRLGAEADPPPVVRDALAATAKAIDRASVRGMAVGVAGLAATVVVVGLAIAAGSVAPLIGLPFTLATLWLARRVGRRPPVVWLRHIGASREQGLDATSFAEWAARLAWESLPAGARERWLGGCYVRAGMAQ